MLWQGINLYYLSVLQRKIASVMGVFIWEYYGKQHQLVIADE